MLIFFELIISKYKIIDDIEARPNNKSHLIAPSNIKFISKFEINPL